MIFKLSDEKQKSPSTLGRAIRSPRYHPHSQPGWALTVHCHERSVANGHHTGSLTIPKGCVQFAAQEGFWVICVALAHTVSGSLPTGDDLLVSVIAFRARIMPQSLNGVNCLLKWLSDSARTYQAKTPIVSGFCLGA